MTFSTEHRADLLTEALVSSFEFSVNNFIFHTEYCCPVINIAQFLFQRFRKEFSDFKAGSELVSCWSEMQILEYFLWLIKLPVQVRSTFLHVHVKGGLNSASDLLGKDGAMRKWEENNRRGNQPPSATSSLPASSFSALVAMANYFSAFPSSWSL